MEDPPLLDNMASNADAPTPSPIDEVKDFFQHISSRAVADNRTRASDNTAASSSLEERPAKYPKENAKGDLGRGKGQNPKAKKRPSRQPECKTEKDQNQDWSN